MPVVHVRANAVDRPSASAALAAITEAVASAVPCAPDAVWCTFTAVETQTIGGAARDDEGRIVYVDVWIRPRADDVSITRALEAACTAAAAGLGVPVDDVWGTLRPVEPLRVFAGGSLIDD